MLKKEIKPWLRLLIAVAFQLTGKFTYSDSYIWAEQHLSKLELDEDNCE